MGLAQRIESGKIILPLVMSYGGSMNADLVRKNLVEVLQLIQASSGLGCPAIVGTTKPVEDLPEFNSKIWPVAVGMLAAKLGVTIPADVNIFRQEKSDVAFTVDQTVAAVLAVIESQVVAEAKQANTQ
jgi:hypothetical protein